MRESAILRHVNTTSPVKGLQIGRMIGLPRYAMSVIVAIQTLVHSTPGWLLGLGVSVLVLHATFRVFSSFTGLNLYFGVSPFAFLVSAIYGVLVPLIVGAVIVASAMRASIVEGLQARGPVKAVAFTVTRATEQLSSGMRYLSSVCVCVSINYRRFDYHHRHWRNVLS